MDAGRRTIVGVVHWDIVAVLCVAIGLGIAQLIPGAPAIPEGLRAPAGWVLLGYSSDLSIYLDSTRIDRRATDSATNSATDSVVGVWLRYIHAKAETAPQYPEALPIKRVELHAGLVCGTGAARIYHVGLTDSTGHSMLERDIASTDTAEGGLAGMATHTVPVVCRWLRNPAVSPMRFGNRSPATPADTTPNWQREP